MFSSQPMFSLIKTLGNSSNCNSMRLKETSFFDILTEQWLNSDLTSVYTQFCLLIYINFSAK